MAPERLAGEDRLLSWLRRRTGSALIGDDAAVLPVRGSLAVTVDSQIAGVHFPAGLDPAVAARRLLAVNLSDLAAMGAAPAYAFLTLAIPSGTAEAALRRYFLALLAACRQHDVELAGGDLSRGGGGGFAATLTLLGTRRPASRWLRRAGARPAEALWLGGTVGESAAGRLLLAAGASWQGRGVNLPAAWRSPAALAAAARRAVRRHLLPQPQLALSAWLARRRCGAAIDVSDGVARDLHRLCRESGAGALVDAAALPMTPSFSRLCSRLAADPVRLALAGGEDYVLLFSLPNRVIPPPVFACRRIGEITAAPHVRLRLDGGDRDLPPVGWDHLD